MKDEIPYCPEDNLSDLSDEFAFGVGKVCFERSREMSKVDLHKFEIRNRPGGEGQPSTGVNTIVLLDGKELKGVRSLKYEVAGGALGKLTLELLAEAAVDINLPLSAEVMLVAEDLEKLAGKDALEVPED